MGRRSQKQAKERFIGIPYRVANSAPFAALKGPEVKLLIDLLTQYNGRNNGSLSPTISLMGKRNWAESSLYRAFKKLEHAGFLLVTRQGWKVRGKATMVAITWNGIDEPTGFSYDEGIKVSAVPLGYWCKAQSHWEHKPRSKNF